MTIELSEPKAKRRIHRTTITTSFPDGKVSFLFGDEYAISMAYAWWKAGMANKKAVFYASFRKIPANGGFAVAGGIDHLNEFLALAKFHDEDLEWLSEKVDDYGNPLYEKEFIEFLRTEKWRCNVYAVKEGTLVFPHEPMVRVEGPIWMCELIEGALLNLISDQSSTMTRAVRMLISANWKPLADNSLRRGGGPGGSLSKALAAWKAGFVSTSNMLASQYFGMKSSGTMAHCWPMSFEEEVQSFITFAKAFPTNSIFLPDTINTINGIRNAIKVGLIMKSQGLKLKGIRLDSGDLSALGKLARKMLDAVGLDFVEVRGTNSLNEFSLDSIERAKTPMDSYASGDAIAESGLFGLVYKLASVEGDDGEMRPTVKLSDQEIKLSTPGRLGAKRYFDRFGKMIADCIYDIDEDKFESECWMTYLNSSGEGLIPSGVTEKELLIPLARNGEIVAPIDEVHEVSKFIREQINSLPEECLRLVNPHLYTVGMTTRLYNLRNELVTNARRKAAEELRMAT